VLVLIAVALGLPCVPSAGAKRLEPRVRQPMRVTFIGDSIAASLEYVPAARSRLERGLRVRFDLAACRRLVQPSCVYNGSAPSTALQAAQAYGSAIGDVLIVAVGYNESGEGYSQGIDRVMRAARSSGANGVVWVTLREVRSVYRPANVSIRRAVGRWRELVVAEWDAYSRGRPWFRSDGLHLTATGAAGFAAFLRPFVFQAARR
jgi:hypothetical protein